MTSIKVIESDKDMEVIMGENEVKDMTQEKVDSGENDNENPEINPENEQNQQESNVNSKIETILEEHGYDNLDEMVQELSASKELQDQVGNRDIKKLLKAQEELDRIHTYWAEKEAEEREKNEMPDETIERLKKEKKELQKKFQKELSARDAEEESAKIIKTYNSEVNNTITKEKLSENEKEFVSKFFGVGNPFNEVDISNKAAVRRMVNDGLKEYKKFKEAIIDDYLKSKGKNPPMSKTDKTSAPSSGGIKSLKDAHKAFREAMTKK